MFACFNGCVGYSPSDYYSLCSCLFVWVRLLLNLVSLSFTCKDVSNDARGVFCDCDYWMMDDDYTDVLWSISCEQWAPLYEKELYFANEICLGNDVRTGKQLESWVQMRSIWRLNEQLEGPWRCPWDQEPGLIWPKWPKVEMRSSDQAFWRGFSSNFGWFWRPKLQQKMKLASEVFFARIGMENWWFLIPISNQIKMIL